MGTNCFIDYLRSIDELKDNHPKHDEPVDFKVKECDALVDIARVKAYEGAANTVKNNPTFYKHTDCIMKKLKTKKWYEQILKKVVLEGTVDMPVEEITKKTEKVDALTHTIFMKCIIDCINEEEYGKKFDHYFKTEDSSSEEEVDTTRDYCDMKHLTDKHMIDTKTYTVELNPSKIDISHIDCDAIMAKHEKEFYEKLEKKLKKVDEDDELKDHQVTCAVTKYHEGDLFHKVLTLKTLNGLKITDEQKGTERDHFMDFMETLTTSMTSCQDNPFDSVIFTKGIAQI